ncbi:MAG: DUF3298 and DUF4163 domain-containing protein [Allosphingosinicella sp.]
MFMPLIIAALLNAASAGQQSKAPVVPPGSEVIERSTRDYNFAYNYPAEAAAVPAIDSLLRKDAREAEAQTRRFAKESRREAGRADRPFLVHEYREEWRTDANLTELLALSGAIYTFTGGAHGNTRFVTFLWDRSAAQRIEFRDLFSDSHAALGALQRQYCPLLETERRERLDGEEGRTDCPDVADQPIAVVAGPSGLIEGFRILIEPYAAGSYAEGTYEIDVPLSDELLRLVRARFAAAFVMR